MPEEKDQLGTGAIEPGAIIAGKYRVERIVGQGGMGVVLAARHTELDQLVAIKLLRPNTATGEVASARFLREARAAARIQSDHAARVFDVGTLDTGHAYMVMEHLDGADLEAVLSSRGPLLIEDAVDYVLEALEAVAQAHSHGIIHRDLKPANLFLARLPDGSRRIKVLDFGISKTITPAGIDAPPGTLTEAGAVLGTPLYMSPEQLKSSSSVDVGSDVWSLGVILHELIAGVPPFRGQTVVEIFASILDDPPEKLRVRRPGAPPELEAIVARCLTRDRAVRYADVGSLALALAPFGSARTAALPAKIAQIVGSREGISAMATTGSIESSLVARLGREGTTTGDVPMKSARSASEKKGWRAPAGVQTVATWSGRVSGGRSSKRWIMPAAALACGLSIGLAVAWRATRPATAAAPQTAQSEALPARPPAPTPSVSASIAQSASIASIAQSASLAPSALVTPSSTVPTVEPAPPGVEVKAPAPRGSAAPIAPIAAPKPSAKAAPAKKSPAELMQDRN